MAENRHTLNSGISLEGRGICRRLCVARMKLPRDKPLRRQDMFVTIAQTSLSWLIQIILWLKCICLFLYWSIFDLQGCVSFRCTAMWFSYTHTHIHTDTYIFFFRLFSHIVCTEYWVEFPVLYSSSFLII